MELEQARVVIRETMNRWGLRDWRLQFRPWLATIAHCDRAKMTIRWSAPFARANAESVVREVTLHEVAHAMTLDEHGPYWQRMYLAIGGSGLRYPSGLQLPRELAKSRRTKREVEEMMVEF